jgi:hypothetical protein
MADLEAGYRLFVVRRAGFRRSRGRDADRRGARRREWIRQFTFAQLSLDVHAGRRIDADGGREEPRRLQLVAACRRAARLAALGFRLGVRPFRLVRLLRAFGSAGRTLAPDESPSPSRIRFVSIREHSHGDAYRRAGGKSPGEDAASTASRGAARVGLELFVVSIVHRVRDGDIR